MQNAAGVGVLEVERQAFLVAVVGVEKMAVARPEAVRADGAPNVAAVGGIFDLDDLGAKIAQQHRAERAGAVLLDRDDPNAGERKHLRVIPRRIAAAASG